MRRAITAFVVLLVAAACAPDTTDTAAPAGEATADAVAGEALYADNCASCHGADLRGTDQGPPHLDPVYEPGHHGDEAFRLAVRRGAPQHHWDFGPMPPVEGLSEQDVEDIIAYVRQRQRAVGIE